MKTTVLSMFAVFSAFVAAAIQDDLSVPVRPGNSAKGIPFWNGCARFFRYAPAFDFPPVPGAMRYRFTLTRQNAPLREGGAAEPPGGVALSSPIRPRRRFRPSGPTCRTASGGSSARDWTPTAPQSARRASASS